MRLEREQLIRLFHEEILLGQPTGYTGTAMELLKSGVPQVIAMRYSVGDAYARELARWFYRLDDGPAVVGIRQPTLRPPWPPASAWTARVRPTTG